MNRKQTMDIAIIVSCATGMLLSYLYLDNRAEKAGSLFILAITGVCFMVLAIRDGKMERQSYGEGGKRKGISEILLLGEDGGITDVWDIYGKTSIVFGKEEGEFQADINLKHTDYAGTVDGEHAVMNYSGGNWYIEDLDSENGTRIQRGGEGKQYKVSSREPCRVEKNDVIYLGLAPIKIR